MSIIGLHMEAIASLAASEILRDNPNSESARKVANKLVEDERDSHEESIEAAKSSKMNFPKP